MSPDSNFLGRVYVLLGKRMRPNTGFGMVLCSALPEDKFLHHPFVSRHSFPVEVSITSYPALRKTAPVKTNISGSSSVTNLRQ